MNMNKLGYQRVVVKSTIKILLYILVVYAVGWIRNES